jgi:hypothetical protein
VCSTPVEIPAAARARWLAEVAEMLGQAEGLLGRLSFAAQDVPLMKELELRIASAKREIESLRTSRPPRADSGPKWSDLHPWERAQPPGT